MTQAAKRLPTKTDRLLQHQNQIKDNYSLNRNKLTPLTISLPAQGAAGAGGDTSSAATGSALRTAGDTMIGPIAFYPVDVFINTGEINIGENASNPSDYSTYVLVTGNPVGDVLSTILGAGFAGQMMKLQAVVDLEITDGASETFGNIITNTNTSIFVPAGSITELLFDVTASTGNVGVQGAWRLASTANPAGEQPEALLLRLSNNQGTEDTILWDDNFIFGNPQPVHIRVVSDGIYELIDGVFSMESSLGLEMSSSGSGSEGVSTWQSSADGITGWGDIIPPNGVLATFATGRPEFTTQPTAKALLDVRGSNIFVRNDFQTPIGSLTGIGISFAASSGLIEYFPEGGSGGGSGGVNNLSELNDVSINSPVQDQVLTYNGTVWVNQASGAGGMATDLSNMVSPTAPTVSLSMNDQDILGVKNLDFDDPSSNIQGLKVLNFFDGSPANRIESSATGLMYSVLPNGEHTFAGANGFIAKFQEINASQRILDMQSNRILNIDKVIFSPVSSADSSGFAQIYEESGFSNLRYVSTVGHTFVQIGAPTLLSIGNFNNEGGLLQDIAFMSFNTTAISTIDQNGEFQQVGDDVFVYSGNQIRNMSDIGAGGAGNSISEGNSNVTVTDAGTGTVNITVDGVGVSSYTTGVGIVHERNLNMTANAILTTGDITPSGTLVRNIGGSTLFYASMFANRYYLNNTGNWITGDSFGADYHVDGSRAHVFDIGGTQKLSINASAVDLLDDLELNGNDLRMASGDITLVDTMSFNGNSSAITAIDFITMYDTQSVLNMNNGNILNGDLIGCSDLSVLDDASIGDDLSIGGNLDHNGSLLGFYGASLQSRQDVPLQGTALFQVVATLSDLLATLQDYGLITSNV